jgi:hypothetical protein
LARKFPGPNQPPELDSAHSDASASEVIVVQEVYRALEVPMTSSAIIVSTVIFIIIAIGVVMAADTMSSSFFRRLLSRDFIGLRGSIMTTMTGRMLMGGRRRSFHRRKGGCRSKQSFTFGFHGNTSQDVARS